MKKKFFKLLALILFVPVLLTGCITLVKSSYKEFEHVSTDLSVWGFYGNIDKGRQTMLSQYETLRGTTKNGYNEFYDILDNQKPLYEALKIGATAVDLKNQTGQQAGKEAYFEFDDLKNYTIIRDGNSDQYTVKFKKSMQYNNIPNRDVVVDSILESLYFNYEIKISVGAVGSSRDQNINFRTYVITEPMQNEIQDAKEKFDKVITNDNVVTTYLLNETSEGNAFEITASKTDTINGQTVSRYVKSIRLTKGVGITIKVENFDGMTTLEKTKTLPAASPIKGFTLSFNQLEGYLGWDMTYSLDATNGEVKYSGESYYQGAKKFLLKEFVNVSKLNAMSFQSSVVTEVNFEGDNFALKAIKSNRFSSLKSQNLLKFGTYDSEPQAFLFSKDKALPVAVFQKYG